MLPQDPMPLLPCPRDLGRCPERTRESHAQPSAVLVFALFVAGQGEGRVCLLRCSWKERLRLPGCLSLHPETQKGSWGLQEGAGRGNQSRSLVANADMLGPHGHWEFAVIKPFLNKETEAKKE